MNSNPKSSRRVATIESPGDRRFLFERRRDNCKIGQHTMGLRVMPSNNHFQCCFCGETIEGSQQVEMLLRVEDGGTQALYAHASCLRRRLHPSVPLSIVENGD
jgi:hypothetical protein